LVHALKEELELIILEPLSSLQVHARYSSKNAMVDHLDSKRRVFVHRRDVARRGGIQANLGVVITHHDCFVVPTSVDERVKFVRLAVGEGDRRRDSQL
jgi:hypothetical protein